MSDLYTAALILRRGYELACRFPACPTGTKRALEHAAIQAEAREIMRTEPDNSTWAQERHFTDLPKASD